VRRPLAVLSAVALAACGAANRLTGRSGAELSYGDVQSIHAGLSAAQVIDAFGRPSRSRHGPDGRVQVLDYAVLDAKGGRARLVLEFDEREVLVRRTFTGEVKAP
jgi:outer membrane protein assembly factor BamE (lipoprotein component of BamABCDE complex)